MKKAGAREVKNRLSAYLRMVEQGERVAITHHGRVVAELGPLQTPPKKKPTPGCGVKPLPDRFA